MATRKPAISTQLKAAQTRIAELEKKLESAESTRKYISDRENKANEELNQLHAFIDALPGSIKRKNEETYVEHGAMTRLAAWLATK